MMVCATKKLFINLFPNKSNTDRNVVHLFFASKLDAWSRDLNTDFTLGGCLFGAIKLTKNSDSDKYKHSGYGIRFDALSQFRLWNGEWGKNVVIFGVGNSSYMHADNRAKDILVLGEGATDGLDDNTVPGEAKYLIVFNKSKNLFKSVLQ